MKLVDIYPLDNQVISNQEQKPIRKRFRISLKIASVLFFLTILVFTLTVIFSKFSNFQSTLSKIGLGKLIRSSGIVKTNSEGFFKALESQIFVYDLNSDGAVTGEDYNIFIAAKESKSSSTNETTTTATTTTTSIEMAAGGDIPLPSVKGFGNDAFYGTATISYPIETFPGEGNIIPELSLSYSSANVDDLCVGTLTSYRNAKPVDGIHTNYQRQAGIAGLGWNLNGFGSITRDMRGTLNEPGDDTFMISFSGGTANLTFESGNPDAYSVWRTVPNLMIKVERYGKCKLHYDANNYPHKVCRYYWVAYTGDGTKYNFGSTELTSDWKRTDDPDSINTFKNLDNSNDDGLWFPLYEKDNPNNGFRAYQYYGPSSTPHAITYKWPLLKTTNIYGKSINYATSFEIMDDDYGGFDNPGHYYVRASYPFKITYPKNEIEFKKEARQDYKIRQGTKDIFVGNQIMFAMNRINKIVVKRQNSANSWKNIKVYILEYKYGYDSSVQTESNPMSGEVIHSLLTKITAWSSDPDTDTSAKRLPSYTFSYGNDCDSFKGGCPLYAMTQKDSASQSRTPNDFFLMSADNGYNGKTEFKYWSDDASNGKALNVKYCDPDKLTNDGAECKVDNEFNTQRHRLASLINHDGMGSSYKTDLLYSTNQPLAYVKNYKEDNTLFSGFEFLGYPDVETKIYEKNSPTTVAALSKTSYHQALNTSNCFKPSPLKGIAYKTQSFDVKNSSHFIESLTNYDVRFGPLFGPWTEEKDTQLNNVCANYDPEKTVTLPYVTQSVQKTYLSSTTPSLCTKTSINYLNPNGIKDPYQNPKITSNWGRVSCTEPYNDNTTDTAKHTYTYYSNADSTNRWIIPKLNETWVSDSPNRDSGTRYNHIRTYFDNLSIGQIGTYLNITKTELMKDGVSYAATSYGYNSTYPWQQTTITDPMAKTTTTTFDSFFRIYPVQVVNALNHVSSVEYDFNTGDITLPNKGQALGMPVKFIDPNGAITYKVYDDFGRLKSLYLPGKSPGANSLPSQIYTYHYFNESDGIPTCNSDTNCLVGLGKNNSPKLMIGEAVRFSDAGGVGQLSAKHSMYDGFGQLVQTRSTWLNNNWTTNLGISVAGEGLKDIITSSSYNALGQIEYQSLPYTSAVYVYPNTSYDPRNFISDTAIKKNFYSYDGLGRSETTTYAVGTVNATIDAVVYDVDNSPLKTKLLDKNCNDGSSATLCTEKIVLDDAFGRTLNTTEVEQGGPNTYTTSYTLHPVLDNPIEVRDTRGNIINKITYNSLGQKIKMWDIDMSPKMSDDANSWRYEYDKLGNLIKQTNPKNIISEIKYDDPLSRPTKKIVAGKTVSETSYDVCDYGKGKICKTISYNADSGNKLEEQSFKYNNRGQLAEETKILSNMPDSVVNGKPFTTKFTYDEGGRTSTMTLPSDSSLGISAETLTYIYNRPYLSYIQSSLGSIRYAKDALYNKNAQITSFRSGNNTTNSYGYNIDNLLLNSIDVAANDDSINIAYSYDPLGNIKQITDKSRPSTDPFSFNQTFIYDYLSRLKSVTNANYTANYTYDNIGNIISKTEKSQLTLAYGSYDPNAINFYHRPKSTETNGIVSNLVYDEIGNLTENANKKFTYDTDNRLVKVTEITEFSSADADRDGDVDWDDYNIWWNNYQSTKFGKDTITGGVAVGDFNSDGFVNGIDYSIWRIGYSSAATVTPTPYSTATPTPASTTSPTATTAPSPTSPPTPTITPTPTPTLSGSCKCSNWKVTSNNCISSIPSCTRRNTCQCVRDPNTY